MRKKIERNGKINPFHIKREYHRTPKKRLLHIICFLSPVAATFIGFSFSEPLWAKITARSCPEVFKFLFSLLFFIVVSIIIFLKTRNTNPTMKMEIEENKEYTEQKHDTQ